MDRRRRRGKGYDRCIRCGRGVPWGRSTCRECNPGDLPSPSPSQYHATVFMAVIVVMAVLAVLAVLRA